MKKTIFDLTKEEGKKLDKEFKKTSYFKQYFTGFIIALVLLAALSSGCTVYVEDYTGIIEMIAFGFMVLLFLLFWFKRFDLLKKYYDEKIEK